MDIPKWYTPNLQINYYEREKNMEKNDYREKMIEMINSITNEGTLEYLYTFLQLFIKKWG